MAVRHRESGSGRDSSVGSLAGAECISEVSAAAPRATVFERNACLIKGLYAAL